MMINGHLKEYILMISLFTNKSFDDKYSYSIKAGLTKLIKLQNESFCLKNTIKPSVLFSVKKMKPSWSTSDLKNRIKRIDFILS